MYRSSLSPSTVGRVNATSGRLRTRHECRNRSSLDLLAVLMLVIGAMFSGCGTPHSGVIVEESVQQRLDETIEVEAYSFNARLKRDGKPTTFKLEIYQTDSMLGLSGRGYLGRGALKGRVTSDSLEVFFPSSKEYVCEALDDLVAGSDCPFPLSEIDIISLFYNLPEHVKLSDGITVVSDYENADRPKYIISAEGCPWKITVTYDRRDPGFRIRSFRFTDGQGTVLRGQREKYRDSAKIKRKRFEVVLPPDAVRLTP